MHQNARASFSASGHALGRGLIIARHNERRKAFFGRGTLLSSLIDRLFYHMYKDSESKRLRNIYPNHYRHTTAAVATDSTAIIGEVVSTN